MTRMKLPSGRIVDLDAIVDGEPVKTGAGDPDSPLVWCKFRFGGAEGYTRGDATALYAALEATVTPKPEGRIVSEEEWQQFEEWRTRVWFRGRGTRLFAAGVTDPERDVIMDAAKAVAGGKLWLGEAIARICREWLAANGAEPSAPPAFPGIASTLLRDCYLEVRFRDPAAALAAYRAVTGANGPGTAKGGGA